MKKTIFEEMGGTYIRHGDYLIPCLALPNSETLIVHLAVVYSIHTVILLEQCWKTEQYRAVL